MSRAARFLMGTVNEEKFSQGQLVRYKSGREKGLLGLVLQPKDDGTVDLKIGKATRVAVPVSDLELAESKEEAEEGESSAADLDSLKPWERLMTKLRGKSVKQKALVSGHLADLLARLLLQTAKGKQLLVKELRDYDISDVLASLGDSGEDEEGMEEPAPEADQDMEPARA